MFEPKTCLCLVIPETRITEYISEVAKVSLKFQLHLPGCFQIHASMMQKVCKHSCASTRHWSLSHQKFPTSTRSLFLAKICLLLFSRCILRDAKQSLILQEAEGPSDLSLSGTGAHERTLNLACECECACASVSVVLLIRKRTTLDFVFPTETKPNPVDCLSLVDIAHSTIRDGVIQVIQVK